MYPPHSSDKNELESKRARSSDPGETADLLFNGRKRGRGVERGRGRINMQGRGRGGGFGVGRGRDREKGAPVSILRKTDAAPRFKPSSPSPSFAEILQRPSSLPIPSPPASSVKQEHSTSNQKETTSSHVVSTPSPIQTPPHPVRKAPVASSSKKASIVHEVRPQKEKITFRFKSLSPLKRKILEVFLVSELFHSFSSFVFSSFLPTLSGKREGVYRVPL